MTCTSPRACIHPRCTAPALPGYGSCFDHALAYADRKLTEAVSFRSWVLARNPDGQLDLLAPPTHLEASRP